ncbi:hypothetical protein L6452_05783 [Arctium lappa]|uniref:Uncharacterized protein n=1 Tax=Arctium lappa TaxID=4217 RepID=A0ACB9EHM9_ARCLA|nr:hypothetical protein L6452_05783 [Arctium lappa]
MRRFKKSFGKKKFYSKPKYDGYKKEKSEMRYKPRHGRREEGREDRKEDRREGKREEKREERKDEPGRCYNCGKFRHFSRDCKFKKVKNSEYYARKSLIAKKAEEGKVLMAEEENWLFQSSDDEEQAHFTQVSYMAKLDGDDEDSEAQSEDANSEVPEHLYNFDKFGSAIRPIPDIRATFVEASSPKPSKETKGQEEMGKNNYETRKIEFTEFESLFTTPSKESVSTNTVPPETACKYDEYESDVDPSTMPSVSSPIASKPLLVKEVEEENAIKNESCVQNDKKEFIESMTEEIFFQMMNASDSDPVSDLKGSNYVNDNTSEMMKQIDMLQQSLDEGEDENFDLKHKLEKSLKVNQELCTEINDLKITLFKNPSNDKHMFNDPSWKVRTNPEFNAPTKPSVVYSDCPEYPPSIFEKGETSNSTRKEPPSKLETNKVPVSVSDIKGIGVGRSKKNKDSSLNKNDRLSIETFASNSCTSDSLILKSNSFDEHECKACRLWVIDSGCSRHMTGFKHLLHNYVEELAGAVRFANSKAEGHVRGYGMLDNGVVKIQKVLYVEGLDHNLFSTSHFYDMKYPDGYEVFKAKRHGNLYYVDFPTLSATRLNFRSIAKLQIQGLVKGLPEMRFEKDSLCSACELGKMKRSSFKSKSESSTSSALELLHMDLCGPMRTASINGKKYVLVMIDDYSRYTWLEFLHDKSDAPELIIAFIKRIQVGLQLPVRTIHSDNGTEFKNVTLKSYLTSVGISHNFSAAYTP